MLGIFWYVNTPSGNPALHNQVSLTRVNGVLQGRFDLVIGGRGVGLNFLKAARADVFLESVRAKPGVDVMNKIFGDFRRFSTKMFAFLKRLFQQFIFLKYTQ
jgi:hypothetical protein